MNLTNKDLKKRIVEISYKHKLSHLSSCLTAVDIIDVIYANKRKGDKFVLSSGHAGLALYVVLEKYEGKNAEKLFEKHGVHPNRDLKDGIYASSGSLGHGIGIAVGMALGNRNENVYVLISDGECAEGSVSESLNVIRNEKLTNIAIVVNYNGFSAYESTIGRYHAMENKLLRVVETNVDYLPFLRGLEGHYHVMNEEEYKFAMELLL